ncbi:MAG: lipoate protein ligase C-terminal domain-containing protein [Candidatus Freyarchaeota archaeon]
MMRGSARLKVPRGKMIEAEIELEKELISYVKITGDFYFYPEEELEKLERVLAGRTIEEVRSTILEFIKDRKITLLGIDEDAIVKVILDAAGRGS